MTTKVGFWNNQNNDYPEYPYADEQIDDTWDEEERAKVLGYVADRRHLSKRYRGYSMCRICGEGNGTADYSDGTYTWPQGFAHYIERHKVKPPQEFIDHILGELDRPFF